MIPFRACFVPFATSVLLACGSSHTDDPGDDGGISFDGGDGGGDAGRDATTDRGEDAGPDPVCGNSELERGEQCDDGNDVDADGCTAGCEREAYCGDGTPDIGEVCDDGEHLSGDGCRSDCLSDETCGNGAVDIHLGEVCDDGNTSDGDTCSADCSAIAGCPNGSIGAGEECDDNNAIAWDGCGRDCRTERSLIMSTLTIGGEDEGCDYSGDGEPDNGFAAALGIAAAYLGSQIEAGIEDGSQIILFGLLGLDDPLASDDDALRLVMMQGTSPAEQPPEEFFTGDAEFYGSSSAFDADGNPITSIQSSIVASKLLGGPEDITLNLPFSGMSIPFTLNQGYVSGTTYVDTETSELGGLSEGLLCGAVALRNLAMIPDPASFFTAPADPCDESGVYGTLADALVGGETIMSFSIGNVPPDVDVDGDGLEAFIVDDDGPAGCQPVIVACFDGDGTRIDGRDCISDERIQDGYSAGLPFEAVRARILGLQP